MKKEFLKVSEVSKIVGLTNRQIRNIIIELKEKDSYQNLLTKDSRGIWNIHKLILSKFKPRRIRKQKYYALTLDLGAKYSNSDIHNIIKYVCNNTKDENLEFNYTIEKKKSNQENHIHTFTNCNKKKLLLKNLKVGFSKLGYKQTDIYDLTNWKNYITKGGNKIIKIKKKENDRINK